MASQYLNDVTTRFGSWRYREAVLRCGLIVLLAPIALRLLFHEQYNLIAAATAFVGLFILSIFARSTSIALTFGYLLLLGDLRRIGDTLYGFPKLDLLIAVGPAMAVVLAVPLLLYLRLTDNLTKVVFALLCLMLLETMNPLQGSIVKGLPGGVLFFITPILWFWVGRRYGTRSLVETLLFKVVLPISCLAAVLGFYQTYVGFLPWEQAWIKYVLMKLTALGIGGNHIRPFGFSVNGADYAYLLAIGCACCTAALFTGKRIFGILLFLLFPMLILASVRSTLVKFVFAVALQWALLSKGKFWVGRVVLFLVLAAAAIGFSASRVTQISGAAQKRASSAQLLISHEANLFNNPGHSTLGGHSTLIVQGVMRGLTNPVGYGLGASTIGVGGHKDGEGSDIGSSEFDFSDVLTCMGIIGGILYLSWIGLTVRELIRLVRHNRTTTSTAAAGVVLCSLGSWTGGPGGYSLAPIYCFLIGSLVLQLPQEAGSVLKAVPIRRRIQGPLSAQEPI